MPAIGFYKTMFKFDAFIPKLSTLDIQMDGVFLPNVSHFSTANHWRSGYGKREERKGKFFASFFFTYIYY